MSINPLFVVHTICLCVKDSSSTSHSDLEDDNAPIGLVTDPVSEAHAAKPKDIVVFVNLVDFFR